MNITLQERFLAAAQAKQILSAYLIVCPRQNIATKLIDEFLQRLYCKAGGCGVCTACRSVCEGHVDILRLDTPKIDDIRDTIAFLSQKPFEGSYRSVVISGADDMTTPAANSMLKTLESPPQNTVILLTARSISGVLPTIISRCAVVHLMPDTNAAHIIQRTLGVDEIRAHILADLSGGFAGDAGQLHGDANFWPMRTETLSTCRKLLTQKNMAISAYADFLEAHKDRLVSILTIMQSFYRDVLVYQKTQNSHLIINRDEAELIAQTALHFTSGVISNIIKVILEAERRFSSPVNFRLAAEKMFFDILEEKNQWKKS